MSVKQVEFTAPAIRFSVVWNGQEVGHAYLYVMTNDGHAQPFGYLEDVYVHEEYRQHGICNELLEAVISEARARQCYKLVATSRNDGSHDSVHAWYMRKGFRASSIGFRMNL